MSASPEEFRAAIEAACDADRTPFEPTKVCDDNGHCRIVRQIVYSFMLWESTLSKAEKAMQGIRSELSDFNELRVCLPSELMSIIGSRYPKAEERCLRLRACLNAIFDHEHQTALPQLETLGKREARMALDALEGMVPFVAARVVLIELGGHCFPVDSRVAGVLGKLADPDELDASIASKLERAFRAGEIAPVYAALERAFDARPPARKSDRRSRKSGSRTS